MKKKSRSKAFSVNLLQLKQKNLIIFLKSLIFCFKQKTLISKAFHLNFFFLQHQIMPSFIIKMSLFVIFVVREVEKIVDFIKKID